ncbi:MAG: LamG-like jellyroll fold domain-containing protein [Elusimicrobiota bacterium]
MAPRVIAPTSNFPTGSSPVSMEGWVRTTFRGLHTAFGYGYQASNQLRAVDIWTENNQSQVLVRLGYYGNDCNVVSNVNVQDGQWHHVAATYDGSITRIYVDGSLKGSCYNGAVNTPSGSTFVIGNRPYTGPSCYMPFNGDIDEVRVQSTVLSAAQIELDARKPIEASWVRVSTDGGKTYALVPGADQSLTGEPGTRSTQTMTARNLSLVESMSSTQPLNFVEMTAKDLLGNATSFTFAIRVDTTPPVVAISTPAAGAVFLAGLDQIPIEFSATDRLDPAPAVTAVLVRTSDTGKADGWLYSLDVSTLQSVDAMLLDDGIWELQVSATDFAGNWSYAASGSFEVKHDTLPPRTTLALGTPKFQAGRVFISTRTELILSAEDDLLETFDNMGSGVAATRHALADGPFSPYEGPLHLLEDGLRSFRYFSMDKAGNVEPVNTSDLAVDAIAPESGLIVQGGSRTLGGTLYARADLGLVFQDPAPNGAASGVKAAFVSINGGDFSSTTTLQALPDESYNLRFYSVDNVENSGEMVEKQVVLDRIAPAAVGLNVVEPSTDSLTLAWMTPGDDAGSDPIASGEMRIWYSSSNSSPELMLAQVVEPVVDQYPQLPKSRRLTGLTSGATYHFALWTMDTAGNWSEPALASAATLALAGSTDAVVWVLSPETALTVTTITPTAVPGAYWAALTQGLAVLTTYYYDIGTVSGDVGFSTPAVIHFVIQPFTGDYQEVSIYRFDEFESEWTSAPIYGLSRVLVLPDRLELTGEILHTSLYGAFIRTDILPPVTVLGIGEPKYVSDRTYVSSATVLTLSPHDDKFVAGDGAGLVAKTEFALDSAALGVYSIPVTLGPMQVADGTHTFKYLSTDASGNEEQVHSVAIALDATAPETALALSTPAVGDFITSATVITLMPSDAGSGLEWTRYRVDSGDLMSEPLSLSLTGADGSHVVEYRSQDRLGNLEPLRTRQLALDDTAPTISITGNPPLAATQDGYLVTSPNVTITLALSDPGSGLGFGQYVLHGATMAFVFDPGDATAQASTLLASGLHVLTVRAADRLGNSHEQAWRISVGGDTQSPQVALLSPCASAAGACKAVEGVISVRGTVSDTNLVSWRLERGSTLISSGAASGEVVGVWDTAGLQGYQSITLTATDAVGNTATASAQVFVGEPSRTLVLGSQKSLHHPQAVASSAGKIYVADTNADKILVFDAQGLPVASFGNTKQVEPYFDKPKAVDVDSAGNMFIADTRHHRVVELSPTGALLLEIGDIRTNKAQNKSFHPGKGNGQFRQPSGVAVGQDGKIYVSDTGNRRIQVFSPDGSFQRAFDLPETDQELDPDDEDNDETAPFGIDVDASGNIYVADAKGRRALVFDPAGTLTLEIDPSGIARRSKKGISARLCERNRGFCRDQKLFKRPEGMAVSQDGTCIFVSDRSLDRILRFDFKGETVLDFGKHGEIKDSKPLPADIVFNKPIGLALDQAGRLLVADRNNERIQGFGLPPETLLIASGEASGRRYGTSSVESVSETAGEGLYARATVEKAKGGAVQRMDRTAVMIPAQALSDDIEVSISLPEGNGFKREEALSKKLLAPVSEPVEYGPDGTQFSAAVTIVLPYDESKAGSPDSLAVHYWNPVKEEWEALASVVDRENRTVSAQTTHFSIYQVLGQGITTAAAADSAFVLREVFAFPNPAVGGAKPTIHVEVGIADQVTIRIYDIAGQPVHQTTLHGAPGLVNGQYAYEYTWDGRIASGVYLYAVDAEKAGQHIRKVGKLAVVR